MLMSGDSGNRLAVDTDHARQRTQRLEGALEEGFPARSVVAVHGEVEGERRQRLRVVAEIGAVRDGQAARQQRAGDQQHG